jgi:hypothetical protein
MKKETAFESFLISFFIWIVCGTLFILMACDETPVVHYSVGQEQCIKISMYGEVYPCSYKDQIEQYKTRYVK